MSKLKIVYFIDFALIVIVGLTMWDKNGVFLIEGILLGLGLALAKPLDEQVRKKRAEKKKNHNK